MNNRIVKVSINDLIVNPERESQMVTHACHREPPMTVSGVCQVGEDLVIAMEKQINQCDVEYVFAPFDSINVDEIITEVGTRYFSGFSMVGGFDVKLQKWALYELRKCD